jgi:oligoribonuclease NrnB/cAMP/cGMP phosphodiesterase (DHH superfamily)
LTEKINDVIVTCQTNKTKFVKQIKNQKSLDKRIIEYEQTIIKSSDRLNEVDELTKKLFEKYVNDKISEDKFYELDISYDSEKIRLVKLISDTESNITVNDIDAFYELIRQYDKITDLQREHINSLVDKVVIHEKKNKLNNRIIDVYFVLIGMI